MFKNIMVCLDGSLISEQTLPYAVEIAARNQGKITLFRSVSEPTVISPNIPGSPGMPVHSSGADRKLEKDLETAQTYLDTRVELLEKERGIQAEAVVIPGPSGESIVYYANENDIDLITIATHGHGGLERAVFGSTADYVVRNSGLPNLVIRPKPEKYLSLNDSETHSFNRILICLDGSHLAEQIVPYVIDQARAFNSQLVLLQVVEEAEEEATISPKASKPVAEKENEFVKNEEKKIHSYLENIADSFSDANLDTQWLTIKGKKPGEAIRYFAVNNKIDLIAMSTHGLSGINRAMFGSVADNVLRNSGLPILIIKPRHDIE